MKHRILARSAAIGLALVFLAFTCSALLPGPGASSRQQVLALRQLGHDYLAASDDLTSRIPAVRQRDDGSLLLVLERCIDYDTLLATGKRVFPAYGISDDFTLALEDCTTGILFLGSLGGASGPACTGRDREERCANVSVAFHPRPRRPGGTVLLVVGSLGVLLLLTGPLYAKPPHADPNSSPAVPPDAEATVITPDCSFSETGLYLLTGTMRQPLTYREAKLLSYFAAHANRVLGRPTIQAAVWGEEGVLTGRSLDVFVSRLRKKLAGVRGVEIQTVHGVGYRLLVAYRMA